MTSEASSHPSPLPWPSDARFVEKVWAFIKISPLTTLAIYTALSLIIRENYPLSDYPMYSNPSPERLYYTVTDGEGKALPIQTLTGITCPKIGKIYRKKAHIVEDETDVNYKKLSPEHTQAIGMEIFAQLRKEATKLQQPMPAILELRRTYISYQDGKVIETPEVLAREPSPSPKAP